MERECSTRKCQEFNAVLIVGQYFISFHIVEVWKEKVYWEAKGIILLKSTM